MKPLWYARRVARMTRGEIADRVRDEVIKRRWRRRRVRDALSDPLVVPSEDLSFSALLPSSALQTVSPNAVARVVGSANELLAGRWRVFDRWREDMVPAPDWSWDPRTGRRAPHDVYCFDVDHRSERAVGNAKYLWELSRHHHCTMLAAAYYVTGDERYAECAARQLRSWWEQNPFLSGVHWTSGIELGIRLIAWVWVRRLLDGWPEVRGVFEGNRIFVQQLHHHQDYLASLPSHGSSANNHLIAEAAGQFVAGCAFPFFSETEAWRGAAWGRLREEIPRQTFPSGLNRELASAYHCFVLELCLAAALEGEAGGHPLGEEVWDVIRAMVDALAATVDVRLRPPRQGDGDDACALLLDSPDFERTASLLATGARLFGAPEWWPPASALDVRTPLWTSLARAPRPNSPRPARRPALFADAGMVFVRDRSGRQDEVWCRADLGPHGYLSIAAHAHADALSFELRVGGVDVLADPGTYCYQGDTSWRAYFRSTLAHNTLQVAGVDQSISGGPFLWTRHAGAEMEHASGLDDGAVAEWRAAHDGYRRLRPPATHRRNLRLDRNEREVTIVDTLECEGEHDCRLAFHLGPEVTCTLEGRTAALSWQNAGELCGASLTLPGEMSWELVSGREDPPAGWYSPAFGVRVPSTSLIGSGRLRGGDTLVTGLQLATAADGPSATATSPAAEPTAARHQERASP